MEDWKLLVDRMQLGRDDHDPAYLKHNGKPVVAVWGIGFNDGRKYTIVECDRLVDFLRNDPKYGGNTVMVGVPTGWRTLNRDAVPDPALHTTLLKADIISPWTVGRYSSLGLVEHHAQACWQPTLPGAGTMVRNSAGGLPRFQLEKHVSRVEGEPHSSAQRRISVAAVRRG